MGSTRYSVKFLLKEPNSESETIIFLIGRFYNQRLKYSTKYKIHPNYWDKSAQKVIISNSHPKLKRLKIKLSEYEQNEHKEINVQIDRYRYQFSFIFNDFVNNKIVPTPSNIRIKLNDEFQLNTKLVSSSQFVDDYIDRFINEIEQGDRLTGGGKRYAKTSITAFNVFKKKFTEFQDFKKKRYNFNEITVDFHDEIVGYFTEKNYALNYIGRHIKNLKTMMRSSKEEGLHKNEEFERKKFKTFKISTEAIYLTLQELEIMYNCDLKGNQELILARDVFLFGCFTALRFSDYCRIQPHHITKTSKGNKIIKIITKKTGDEVSIPVWHWILDELVKKYKGSVPKTYEQLLNKNIKLVGKEAKINTIVETEKIKGGKKVITQTPKYKLITTHTARRSGASNMVVTKMSNLDVMKITGHKSESSFMKYIKISKEETADKIMKDHFIAKPLVSKTAN